MIKRSRNHSMLSISRGDNCGLFGLMKFPCGCIACGILGILQLRCIDFSPWSGKMASFVASLCSRTSSEMYLDGPRQTQYDSVIQQPITFLSGQIPSSLGIQDVLNWGLASSHSSDADLGVHPRIQTWMAHLASCASPRNPVSKCFKNARCCHSYHIIPQHSTSILPAGTTCSF
jgi:hypothetical protein